MIKKKTPTIQSFCDDFLLNPFFSLKRTLSTYINFLFFFLMMKKSIFIRVCWSLVLMDPFSLLFLEPITPRVILFENNSIVRRQEGPVLCCWPYFSYSDISKRKHFFSQKYTEVGIPHFDNRARQTRQLMGQIKYKNARSAGSV